jgi:hypothetical protein
MMAPAGNKVIKMKDVGFEVNGKSIIRNFTYEFAPGAGINRRLGSAPW